MELVQKVSLRPTVFAKRVYQELSSQCTAMQAVLLVRLVTVRLVSFGLCATAPVKAYVNDAQMLLKVLFTRGVRVQSSNHKNVTGHVIERVDMFH